MTDDTAVNAAAAVADDVIEDQGPGHEMRYGAIVADSNGDVILHASVDDYLGAITAAHADGFDQLIDLTAVDYLTYAGKRALPEGVDAGRYELVTALINHHRRERIRIRVQLDGDEPTIPTAFDLYPGAEYLEREVYDMFGIVFADHPDMSRVLMPEDWVGHPLRKDYAVGSIPVQFKAASNQR
jgi:NADH-quinone oxidoreductase subunit C